MTPTTMKPLLKALVPALALLLCACQGARRSPEPRQIRLPAYSDPAREFVRKGSETPVEEESEPEMFRRLDEGFGRAGEVRDGVYRLVTPRADLLVTMNGWDVPTGAFLESDFRFWRCPCGKALVTGQFVVADYEANDVVDELLEGGLHVASMAPLMLDERPRLLLIRFQGEGRSRELAAALKSALAYTGEARNQPLPVDLSPPDR